MTDRSSNDQAPSIADTPSSTHAPKTIAWFHPVSGIAGDMALGALLDAGADVEFVCEAIGSLGLAGWNLTAEPTTRGALAATRAVVKTDEQHHHRRWRDIDALLSEAEFPGGASSAGERIRARARAVFEALAEAEAAVHGIEPAEVHFHEVGALDAIVDIVGVAAALESLGVDEVACGSVAVGMGQVSTEHGVLPNPAPAVVKLLDGFEVKGVETSVELTTPTGAAIVAALAGDAVRSMSSPKSRSAVLGASRSVPLPAMTIVGSGFGAGTADPKDRPNVTQVVIGTAAVAASASASLLSTDTETQLPDNAPAAESSLSTETAVLAELATNLDDVSGEVIAGAIEALMEAGALDAWVVPIVMKKGRPAHTLCVLCEPAAAPLFVAQVMSLTGTLGVRAWSVERASVERRNVVVDLDGQAVSVKVSPHRAKAEADDVAAAAKALGISPLEVARRAEAAARAAARSPLT